MKLDPVPFRLHCYEGIYMKLFMTQSNQKFADFREEIITKRFFGIGITKSISLSFIFNMTLAS